jgi:hypothetical protein
MLTNIIKWDIYEIKTKTTPIHGVMLRGRIRKYCLENDLNVLVENASDLENTVRFAIPTGENPNNINNYLEKIISDYLVELVKESVPNPVLSKLKVNIEDRYTL